MELNPTVPPGVKEYLSLKANNAEVIGVKKFNVIFKGSYSQLFPSNLKRRFSSFLTENLAQFSFFSEH